jgi:hypothetical protein
MNVLTAEVLSSSILGAGVFGTSLYSHLGVMAVHLASVLKMSVRSNIPPFDWRRLGVL